MFSVLHNLEYLACKAISLHPVTDGVKEEAIKNNIFFFSDTSRSNRSAGNNVLPRLMPKLSETLVKTFLNYNFPFH
jgi:hypothetical protein